MAAAPSVDVAAARAADAAWWRKAIRVVVAQLPEKPDRTRAGFNAALDEAIEHAAAWDWDSLEALHGEMVEVIADRLKAGRLDVKFLGRRKAGDREIRFFVEVPWGWQARINVPATFIVRKSNN